MEFNNTHEELKPFIEEQVRRFISTYDRLREIPGAEKLCIGLDMSLAKIAWRKTAKDIWLTPDARNFEKRTGGTI